MFHGMEYVYEVYKVRSFSKAAQNLYISQPSLSAAVKKIEAQIGAPIFDRGSSPLRLTEPGKEYIKCVEKILNVKNEFHHYMKDMDELKKGQLSIGASNYFASFILPPVITDFTKQYPNVKVILNETNSAHLENKLLSGSLDFVLDNSVYNSKIYESYPYFKEQLLLVVPAKFTSNERVTDLQLTGEDIKNGRHLKDRDEFVDLSVFKEDPFIFLRFGNDTRRRADKICQDAGFTPKIVLKLEQQVTAYYMAANGMGITFASDKLIQKIESNPSLIYYKLDKNIASREVFFYRKQSRYISKAMEEFLKIALSQ